MSPRAQLVLYRYAVGSHWLKNASQTAMRSETLHLTQKFILICFCCSFVETIDGIRAERQVTASPGGRLVTNGLFTVDTASQRE